MNISYITATDLKHDTANIINAVAYGNTIAVVKRHGKELIRMVPSHYHANQSKDSIKIKKTLVTKYSRLLDESESENVTKNMAEFRDQFSVSSEV